MTRYTSPINGEVVNLYPNPLDGSYGIEPGDDVSSSDLSTARTLIACLPIAAALWAVLLWGLL